MNKLRVAGAIGGAVATAAICLVVSAAGASASTDSACGYYEENLTGYYNHCGQGQVKIQIDYQIGNTTRCVGPGITEVGTKTNPAWPWTYVNNAFYIGSC